jgi:phosphoenolpyruvate phosphomutase|tara:strand:- start:13869 stop:14765 length:897 start_codon:yes stop_codon:yes gene_type:complete
MLTSEILQKELKAKPILKVGGAFDAMSAKLIEINGFDAIWAGSFAISATHALPDASIMTMTEFLAVASNMVESCKIPVIADCDTGFGGPSNISHMIKKYENSGIAAVSIEDKIFPKQNSLLENGRQELISEKEFVAKIIAAREAKQNKEFMIIARTEALIAGMGMNEAIKRAHAYEDAGADAILIHSKKDTPNEIFEFSDMWNGNIPLVVVPTSYPSVNLDELISHKIRMVIYANQSLRVAHAAMSRVLQEINKTKSLSEVEEKMSTMEQIFELQEMYNIKKEEEAVEEELKKLGYLK